MYHKDLEREETHYGKVNIKVAWLDDGQPYDKGEVPSDFLDKLKKIEPRIYTKGWHTCPFCRGETSSTQFMIPVEGEDKTFYDVPEMIIHYIEVHNYLPPQEFIDAVMNLEIERPRVTRSNRFK